MRELAFSPDGTTVLAVSHDGIVRLWDTATGQDRRGPGIPFEGEVSALAASRDGKTAFVADASGAIAIVSLARGESVGSLVGHTGRVRQIELSPDGTHALTASEDGTVRAWDLARRAQVRSAPSSGGGLCFVDNELALWALAPETLGLCRWRDGSLVRRSSGENVSWVALVPESRAKLVTCSADGTVRVRDALSGDTLEASEPLEPNAFWAVATARSVPSPWPTRACAPSPAAARASRRPPGSSSRRERSSRPRSRETRRRSSSRSPRGRSSSSMHEQRAFRGEHSPYRERGRSAEIVAEPDGRRVLVGTARGVVLELELLAR